MELELGLQLLVQGLPAIAQIFTALQEERLAVIKREQAKEFHKLKPHPDSEKVAENRDFHRWQFEKEIAAYHRETVLQLVDAGREIVQKFAEFQKVIENWPLTLLPAQLLNNSPTNSPKPLQILLAPLQIENHNALWQTIPNFELKLAQELREFLSQNYSLDSQTRPTELIAGAWKEQHFHQEASIKALFETLKSEPTLILQSEIIGEHLNFRIAYWGLGQKTYTYKTIISKLAYREIVDAAAKNRALKWKETANKLLACGASIEEVNQLGGDNIANLELVEKEEKWQSFGIATKDFNLQYQVNDQDFSILFQLLVDYHCFISSCIADIHHLINYAIPPLFPTLLSSFTVVSKENGQELVRSLLAIYGNIFQVLENEQPARVLELALKLAQSLTVLPNKKLAQEQTEYAIKLWLKQRQSPLTEHHESLAALQSAITPEDREFLENLKVCLPAIGDETCLHHVCRLLSAIEDLSSKNTSRENVLTIPDKNQSSLVKIQSHASSLTKFKPDFKLENISIIHTLNGHSGKASSIAVSHDGSTLASGGDDNTIKLWHLGTGELLQTLNGDSGRVLAINLSPDGQILASSHRTSDRSCIKIWQLDNGELLETLTGHHKWIYSLAISPNGQTLVSGGHKIKTWDLRTGTPLHTLTGHKKLVYSLAISPDGERFASSGGDKTIKIWHLPTGELIHNLSGHFDWVRSVVISPDGEILASGSDDNTIKLWNLPTGKLFRTLIGHSDWVLSLAISPDGKTLISGSKDNTIKLWHLETGKLLATLTGHKKWVYSLAVSPDGHTFASGSEDKTVKIWRTL